MPAASGELAQIVNEGGTRMYATVHLPGRPQREVQIFTIPFKIQNFAIEKEPS